MFQRILQWIREAWAKMIGQTNVKQALKVDIAISPDMAAALELWSLMYYNQAPWLTKDIKSLNLPASIAGEIARVVTVEMRVEFTGSARAKFLEQQFAPVLAKIREKLEVGCAKGGLMLKPYVTGNQIAIDYVQADQFYPVSFDTNGNITACVFADQRQVGNDYYTRLEYHQMTAQGCEITNLAFKSSARDALGSPVPLATVEAWAEIQPQAVITGIDRPLYAYFRFPQANNVDYYNNTPLGVSCYARAVNLIEDADKQYSDLIWEFRSGQRAVYADVLAFTKDEDGKPVLPDKRLYRTLNATGDVGSQNKLYEEWSPDFREASILSGLDAILKKIEYTTGLAYGTISDPNVEAKTATEITMTRQRTYTTIVDTRKALQSALDQLLYAMDVWATLANLAPRGTYAASYDFDDSVIVDKDAQFKQDLQLVNNGIMGKVEFRMRNFGEDEVTATQKIKAVTDERIADENAGYQGATVQQ